ncbi:MAG: zinc dependent phospholipase C family protein [Solobacterium sp.]|nr:zinc dependent phospholipase C family protein [Solobacterium sp.]MBR0214265.1 zinc dependent phospholipase C family protein [Solobacterium sp.]
MPAATTHVEFARDVYARLPEELQKTITDLPMYCLGSQGPDLFFFSRAYFLPGSLTWVGSRLHGEKVEEVLRWMDAYTKERPLLRSYYAGYLCHYALDSSCHMIICSYARREAEQRGCTDSEAHFAIEGELDIWALRRHSKTPENYSVHDDLKVSRDAAVKLARMYNLMLLEIFGIYISERKLLEAIFGIHRLTRALKPGSLMKYRVADRMENLLRMPKLITGMMLDGKGAKDPDVLNPDHLVYANVDYPELTDSHSFAELYDLAEEKAAALFADLDSVPIDTDFNGNPIQK